MEPKLTNYSAHRQLQINIDPWKHQVDGSMQCIEVTLEKWSNGLGSGFKFYSSIGSVISSGK